MSKGRKVPPAQPPTVMAGMFNLDEMWDAAGRPADRHPIDFVQSPQGRTLIRQGLEQGLRIDEIMVTTNSAIQDVIDAIADEWHAEQAPPA